MMTGADVFAERACDRLTAGNMAGIDFDGMPLLMFRADTTTTQTKAGFFASLYAGLWLDAHHAGAPDYDRERSLARWRRAIHRELENGTP